MWKKIISLVLVLMMVSTGWGQEVNDSLVILTVEDIRVITKMTEDLKYTKAELEAADSIIDRQRKIIELKDEVLTVKEQILTSERQRLKRRTRKFSIISGGLGLVVGVICGYFIL